MSGIIVRYFAAAADAAGREEELWEAPGDATLSALRDDLSARYGDPMRRVLRSGSFLVNGTVRCDDGAVTGTTIDVLPAFAGG